MMLDIIWPDSDERKPYSVKKGTATATGAVIIMCLKVYMYVVCPLLYVYRCTCAHACVVYVMAVACVLLS